MLFVLFGGKIGRSGRKKHYVFKGNPQIRAPKTIELGKSAKITHVQGAGVWREFIHAISCIEAKTNKKQNKQKKASEDPREA